MATCLIAALDEGARLPHREAHRAHLGLADAPQRHAVNVVGRESVHGGAGQSSLLGRKVGPQADHADSPQVDAARLEAEAGPAVGRSEERDAVRRRVLLDEAHQRAHGILAGQRAAGFAGECARLAVADCVAEAHRHALGHANARQI